MKIKELFVNCKLKISKFRRGLTKIAFFLTVLVSIFAIFAKLTVPPAAGAWYDDTYSYRLKITFTHNADISADRAVTYTLDTAELIAANIMQSDCDDTRFTDGSGKPLLYDLTGTCNNASTTYEVIFPTIVNGSNLAYVYYGNPAAVNGEISSTGYTALTPSGGDPASTTPTSDDEQGPTPISYWNFDEAQGSTANDYSTGSNNDLTITNALWKTSDLCVFGNCLYFDGNTDYATKSYSTDTELLPGTGSFTVSAWLKHTSTAGADTAISRVDAVAGVGWKVYMNSSGYLCIGIDAVAGTFPNDDACTPTTYADSQWHYVTAVKNTTTNIQLYVDGNLLDTQTSITTSSLDGTNAPFTVGNDFDAGTNGWDGFIDEVKYYAFAKTADQIKTEFASRGAVKGVSASFGPDTQKSLSTGLVGYWKMDDSGIDAEGETSTDSSGNGNSGTLYGDNGVGDNGTGLDCTAAGKFGTSCNFDGTDDYLDMGNPDSLRYIDSDYSWTVSVWYRSTDASSIRKYLIYRTGAWNITCGDEYGNKTCRFSRIGGGYPYINSNNNSFTPNVWQHLVVTGTGTARTIRLYVNGIDQTGSYTEDFSWDGYYAGENFIVSNRPENSNVWQGDIDDMRIYNRALSPAEVSQLYNFAPGPVGWWKLDENTGTSANDSSGNGNTSSAFTGNVAWTTGKFGSGLSFDGTDDVVRIVESSSTDLGATTDSYTVTAWIKTSASCAVGCTIVGKMTSAVTAHPYRLYVSSSNQPAFNIHDGTNNPDVNKGISINDGNWHFLVGVRDVSTDKIYIYLDSVNSNSATDTTTTTTVNNDDISIGNAGGSYISNDFDGQIDDVRVYNYARTPKQIVEDMNAGHPAGGSPIGSQAVYWPFDEGQGTTANNSGFASSSNGTLTSIASPATATSGWTFTGKVNKGIIFDGTDDNVVMATANDEAVDFATTEQFSASAWVYVTTMPGSGNQDAIIAKWDETGNLAAYKLYVENDDADTTGNFEVQIYDESASQAITASQAIDQVAVNTWYHVAFTFNGGVAGAAGDLKLYVNGNLTAQNAANASFLGLEDKASDFTVGDYDAGDVVANNTAFTGTIDEVKVYSGLLSQSEIQVDMNAGSAAALGGVLGTQDNEGFGGNPPVGEWKFEEGSGGSVYDTSGNGYTGTWSGTGSRYTYGKLGWAGNFNSTTSDRINFGDILDFSGDLTLEAWFKSTGGDGTSPMIINKAATAGSLGYALTIDDTPNTLRFVVYNTVNSGWLETFSTTVVMADGLWHHAEGVISGSTAYLYLDGKLEATDNTTSGTRVTNSPDQLQIGQRNTTNYFVGLIDQARIYNYARSAAQIAYDYNRGAPVAQYDFDECQGSTAYNAALNANNQAAGMNGTITPGSLGNTTVGDCTTSGSTMWFNGATGKYNSSLDFDGTDDYVSISDNANLDTNLKNLSISFWAKLNTLVNYDFFLAKQVSTSADGSYGFLLTNDTPQKLSFRLWSDLNTNTINSDGGFPTGTWTHVAGTWNGTLMKLYINGVQQQVGVDKYNIGNNVMNSAYNLMIGAASDLSNYIDAQIDDVRIYNYAHTADQVKRLYNEGSAVRFGPQTGSP